MQYPGPVGSTLEQLLFGVFAFFAVLSALGVVALRDPIKGALSLIGSFFCLASLFVLQRAELMAVLQVLVYAGAIMVLFVFVLMLVDDKNAALFSPAVGEKVTIPIKLGAVAVIAGGLLYTAIASNLDTRAPLPEDFGSPAGVGRHFFENYVFHFEMTSILLLAGIVGAVVISRRGRDRRE